MRADFEHLELVEDAEAGCTAWIALHLTRLGPAFGGIRRRAYRSRQDALAEVGELASAMTLKCAIAGVPGGGGKAVLIDGPDLDRPAAYRAIGRAVERLGGRFYTGPDAGTGAADLEQVARETRYVARPGPGGPGNLAEPTALGVFAGIEAVARRLGRRNLEGLHVAVQGLGEVGMRLAQRLRDAGARLTVADVLGPAVERARVELGAAAVAPGAITAVACDVFAPCALGHVIDDAALAVLRARAVAGSANNVLASPRHGRELAARGVLYAPDFAINAGALIHGALFHLEGRAPPPSRIHAIGDIVGEILDRAAAEGEPPERIALRQAERRVAAGAERRAP